MTVSWKAQVSSAVGMIWSAGSRKLQKYTYVRHSPTFDLILPMQSSVPQLHAGGEANTHLPMGPVSGASTGNVQHAGDAANLLIENVHKTLYNHSASR